VESSATAGNTAKLEATAPYRAVAMTVRKRLTVVMVVS
jgi:hypothetical protein